MGTSTSSASASTASSHSSAPSSTASSTSSPPASRASSPPSATSSRANSTSSPQASSCTSVIGHSPATLSGARSFAGTRPLAWPCWRTNVTSFSKFSSRGCLAAHRSATSSSISRKGTVSMSVPPCFKTRFCSQTRVSSAFTAESSCPAALTSISLCWSCAALLRPLAAAGLLSMVLIPPSSGCWLENIGLNSGTTGQSNRSAFSAGRRQMAQVMGLKGGSWLRGGARGGAPSSSAARQRTMRPALA
mmetsp:Transcript_35383/g.95930  ORF Transcript_35383/g.95930 Transcript_35383/m.95930 type:complete len:247 (-) Transcript_35383:210-950(-)